MIVYHGTTERRARRICADGFFPKKPSRRVWFAETKGYALGRARTQARRTHDRPVVLTCELNIAHARERFGKKKVFHKHGVIAIDARVPVSVLRSFPGAIDTPVSPQELADWVNYLLGLRRHKGVGPRNPGIQRMSRWAVKRLSSGGKKTIKSTELVDKARRFLPELFEDYIIDAEHMLAYRRVKTIKVETAVAGSAPRQEAEALECLDSSKVERRVRGLSILAEIRDPDLYEWCMMCLEDSSVNVRVAALRTMHICDSIHPEDIVPLTDSENKQIRGAAIAVLAKHSANAREKTSWFRRGLTDPNPCVRVEAARLLPDLDPKAFKAIFAIALHDPNRDVARRARKLTEHKGYAAWRR